MNQATPSVAFDPAGSAEFDARVATELVRELRARLVGDSGLVLFGHLALIGLVAIMIWGDEPGLKMEWWTVAVAVTTVLRAVWMRHAGKAHVGNRAVVIGTRSTVLLQAAAWGIGGAVLMTVSRPEQVAVICVVFCGIVGGSLATLSADMPSFYCMVVAICAPLPFGLLASSSSRENVVLSGLVLVFAVIGTGLARRAHSNLTVQLETLVSLALSEERIALLLGSTAEGIYGVDLAGNCTFANQAGLLLLGYKDLEEVLGRNMHQLSHHTLPDGTSRSQSSCRIYQAFQERRDIHVDDEMFWRADGSSFPVEYWSHLIIRDAKVLGAVVTFLDITERRRSEDEVRASEARFRGVAESNIIGIGFWNATGVITDANDEYLRTIGYTREDLAAGLVNFRTMTPPEYAEIDAAAITRIRNGGTVGLWEKELYRKDGYRVEVVVGVATQKERPDHGVVFQLDVTERRRVERALKDSETRFRRVVESNILAVILWEPDGRIYEANDEMLKMFGYTREDLAAGRLNWRKMTPPEWEATDARALASFMTGQTLPPWEKELYRKDGTRVPVMLGAAPLNEPGNRGVAMILDISERKRIERDVRLSEARFRQVSESNLVGICFFDSAGRLSETNDELLRIFGFTRQDEIEDPDRLRVNWRALSPPESAEWDAATLAMVMAGGTCPPTEREYFRKDGSRIWVLLGLAKLTEGSDRGIAVVLDISERKRSEEQSRWKAALLAAQVRSSADGILIVDRQGKKILQNERMSEQLGIPPDIASDADDARQIRYVLTRMKHPDQFLARVHHLNDHPKEVSHDELELIDGTVLDRYSAPVSGEQGEQYGRIWTFHDVTEHKQLAEAMRKARDQAREAAETRSMFLANMSHEIRTPMNAVLGMVEIVLETELTMEQRHSLDVVQSSGESLLAIINDILDYSKIEAGHLDVETIPFDLPRLVYSTTSMLAVKAREKDLEIIPDVAPDIPVAVSGDPSRLRQVLTNLIGNAVKFTAAGEVVVSLRTATLADGRAAVGFVVRDTGIGIAPDRLAHIFEEFTQADGSTSRRFGGTGLGLTIAQRLVNLMGGHIIATSEVGRGSEFAFVLPLPVADQVGVRPPVTVSLAGQRILIVDDNPTNRRIYHEMLGADHPRLDQATDAVSALAALQAARDEGAAATVAIIDVRMPGVDGFALASQIRSDPSLAGIAILMMTSGGQRGDAARCRELGVNGYLTKPVSRTDLLDAVASILHGSGNLGTGQVVTRHALTESRKPLRILLADDNPVNQEVAATMLRMRGHQVDTVANGREAVSAVERGGYDLVLMDIQMPEMDGFEATAAIRALGTLGSLPIIALTAHALSGERERCLANGMDGYLAKPFRAHDLLAVVERRVTGDGAIVGEAPKPRAVRAVDLEILREQLRAAGAEDALDGIVDTYLGSAPVRVASLCLALGSGTAEEVSTAAHALKSSAGAIGAGPLAKLLAGVEASGRADTLTDRPGLSDRIRAAATAVQLELQAYRRMAA
ncbi:MAG: PAS domain S-box protein [Gemmatimonadota bacterium]